MTRRFFLSLFGAMASLPVFASRLRRKKAQPRIAATGMHFGPMTVTGIAMEPICAGDLVVWEYPAAPIRVRRARDSADFSRAVRRGNSGCAANDQRVGGKVIAYVNGQMLVRVTGWTA